MGVELREEMRNEDYGRRWTSPVAAYYENLVRVTQDDPHH